MSQWQVAFDKAVGKKGQIVTVREWPELHFRPERFLISDGREGRVTRVVRLMIGPAIHVFGEAGFLSADLSMKKMDLDECLLGQSISFLVEFLEDAEWQCTLIGTARHPKRSGW